MSTGPEGTPAPEDTGTGTGGTTDGPEGTPGGENTPPEPSGLEKALAAERKARRESDAKLHAAEEALAKAANQSLSEQERAIAEAKAAGAAEAAAVYQKQLLEAKVVTAATGANFHDPELATSLIALPADADDKEIKEALAQLAKDRPYLVKGGVTPPIGQGPRGNGPVQTADDWLRQAAASK